MSKILHSRWHAMGLLTLLLLALCPSRANAISGNVNVSQLGTTTRVDLEGNTTITVDQDWSLRSIIGADYDLKIILTNGAQLMVDQDKSKSPAIEVKSLDVSGNGELYVTGKNNGVLLKGGDLKVTDCNASFVGRQDQDGSNYWGTAVEGDINDVIISNAKVDISGALLGIGTSCKKIKITGANSVLNAWAQWHCIQPEDFIMEGGEVNLTTRIGCPLNVRKGSANITGGKLTISAGESWCGMRFNEELVASGCELNINSTYEAINSPGGSATFTNAKVNINVGKSHRGIDLGGNLTIDGTSDFSVNASHEAIYCAGDMSLKADRFYAKARTKECRAVSVEGQLAIHMGEGTYEAIPGEGDFSIGHEPYPFYAGQGITVDKPYMINGRHDLYNINIESHDHQYFCDELRTINYQLFHGAIFGPVKITRPDLIHYKQDDTWSHIVDGCFDKSSYSVAELIHFSVPDVITDFINVPVSNPNPGLHIIWYRSYTNEEGRIIYEKLDNDNRTSYYTEADDVGKGISAQFFFDTHINTLTSEVVTVQKRVNNVTPTKPALAFRQNYVWVTNNHPSQEYLLLTTYKDVKNLTEADWANAESSTASSFRLSGTTGQVNYVYTRYKETQVQLAGSVVLYDAVYYGTTDQIKDIMFDITDVTANTKVEIGKGGFTPVPINHVIKIDLVTVPGDIVGFQGLKGEDWWIESAVTYYRDAACTQEIHDGEFNRPLDYDTYYKTLYVKFTEPTEVLSGTNPNHAHYVTFTYNNISKEVNFIVSKADGTYNLLDLYATTNGATLDGNYQALYVPAGATFETPMDYTPVEASTDGITFWLNGYSQNGVANTGNPPTLSYYKDSDGQLMLRVNTTNTEDGFYGEYRAKQDGRDVPLNSPALFLYVTAPEATGLAINPEEITLEPLFGEAQLDATFIPANAKPLPITWSSDNQNVMVDETGKVTLGDDAIGETATITATAGEFTATCTVIVSGQRYPVWLKGTQINTLIQDDVFMDGTVSYEPGKLTLNGATITGTATKPAVKSEVPNLTINVRGTNNLSVSSGEAVALTESAHIAGDGELNLTTNSGSNLSVTLAGYKDITVDDSVKVSATNNSSSGIGVLALGNLSVNSPEAQLRGRGKFASVGYGRELVGNIVEPEDAQPVYYAGLDGYFIGDASGNIVKDDWVTIDGSLIRTENFTGTLWQEITSNGTLSSSSETGKTMKLTYSLETPEVAEITFPSFTRAGSTDKVNGFTINDVDAYEYNDAILYALPAETSMMLSVGKGTRMPVYHMMVKGAKVAGQLVLKLTMTGRINGAEFTLWFGPDSMTLDAIKAALGTAEEIITDVDGIESETKEDVIYDLSGRKIERITQPGIYIKNGKKILVK